MKWLSLFIQFILRFLMVISIIFVAIISLASAVIYFIDVNQHKDLISQVFYQSTGQTLTLNGPMDISLVPKPKFIFNDSSIHFNVKDNFVTIGAESIMINLPWKAIFGAKVNVSAIQSKKMTVQVVDKSGKSEVFNIDEFSGKVKSTCCDLTISDFKLLNGNQSLTGNIYIAMFTNTPEISGKMALNELTLVPDLRVNLFSMLSFNWLKDAKGQITVKVAKLNLGKTTLNDATIKINIKDKSFEIVKPKDAKKSGISGNLHFQQLTQKVTQVDGTLNIPQLKIPGNEPASSTRSNGRVFSSLPFQIPELASLKGEVEVHIDDLIFHQIHMNAAKTNLNLNNHSLQLIAKMNGGDFTAKIVQNRAFNKNGAFNIEFKFANVNASDFFRQFHPHAVSKGGVFDLQFKGSSYGDSTASVMANLTGKALIKINQLFILNEQIDSSVVDIFAALWSALTPKAKGTLIECTVMRFNIQHGLMVAKEGIGMQTSDLYALGGGELNLRSEQLNFMIDLYPRSQANIEIGSFNNIIYVQGTLSQPKIYTTALGVIQEGGTIALGIATSGISLLVEKLVKLATKSQSPCQKVLLAGE
ncbi:MAG: AsmA family protein [Candidatus Berkiellales bacterium]